MSERPEVTGEVRQWIADVTGADDLTLIQVSGGASRQAWFVDAHTGAGSRELFLRYDPREPDPHSAFHPCRSKPRSWPNCIGTG